MKKIIVQIIVILFYAFSANVNAQIYMMGVAPLNPGNLWKYVDIGWLGGQSNFFVSDSSITLGNYSYSIVEVFRDGNITRHKRYLGLSQNNYYVKFDTLAPDSNYKYYKKDCNIGDFWAQQYYIDLYDFVIIDTLTINAWGQSFFSKVVKITDHSLVEVYQVWADSIGLIEENSIGQYDMILRGCVINGVVYGDTTTVGVKDDFDIAKNYELLQNYPNPFNPMTKISFYLPFGSHVLLKVYNLFGKEVSTLVNEYRSAGRYTELFDGEGLSSGVYIYSLRVNEFLQNKKMTLLK